MSGEQPTSTSDGTPDTEASRREQEAVLRAAAQRRRFENWQHATTIDLIERHPLMKKGPERRQVANNLWRILENLEGRKPPIRKKDVLHARHRF